MEKTILCLIKYFSCLTSITENMNHILFYDCYSWKVCLVGIMLSKKKLHEEASKKKILSWAEVCTQYGLNH